MLAQLQSVALVGLSAELIEVEIDLHRGLPSFSIVGLTDASIQESRERVRSAIKNAGLDFPRQKLSVNLAPADLKKKGPQYDLPIAIGVLAASGQVALPNEKAIFLGELSFTGELRGVSGILPAMSGAAKKGITVAYVPEANAAEAALVDGMTVYAVRDLASLLNHLSGTEPLTPAEQLAPEMEHNPHAADADMMHIKGQEQAKRALEIAAAGGHNILMVGPPGSGKTMLAKAFTTILPKLELREMLEVTQVHSISGLTSRDVPMVTTRPFRVVHHTASPVAIVGGGNPPSPGEISLAHRGVLFLDEFAEFAQKTLEVMRQPLEDGVITVSRASGSVQFPAQFMLVAAMNPTPSGYDEHDPRCTDSAHAIRKYKGKISGPILDRIDLHLQVPHIPFEQLNTLENGETSDTIRTRVEAARAIQAARLSGTNAVTNAEMTSPQVRTHCPMTDEASTLLQVAVQQMGLSGRAYYRVLKLARTIADLAQKDLLLPHHIAEAIGYRQRSQV